MDKRKTRRDDCTKCSYLGKTKFCDFYDAIFMECRNIKVCPEGYDSELDDEEDVELKIDKT